MKILKKRKNVILVCLLILLAGAIVWVMLSETGKVLEEHLISSDGKIELDVWRRSDVDGFEWKNSKGPSWSTSIYAIQGVTEFRGGSFSSDNRHLLLVFADANGREQYHWTDYESSLSGGLPLEISCKAEENFAAEIKEERSWTDISFHFCGWHPNKNLALFAYELTTASCSKHSGYFWYDVEARYKENAVYVKELPLD